MSYESGQKITTSDIVNQFVSKVVNTAKSGAIDASNVPKSSYYSQYVVNPSWLGTFSSLDLKPTIGSSGAKVTANNTLTYNSLYSAMIYITKLLLRIGTYEYYEHYGNGSGYTKVYSKSGKALFNASSYNKVSSGCGLNPSTPGNGGVTANSIMSITSISALITNCCNAWSNGVKPHSRKINYQCHTNCHTDCHNNCHKECYSHTNKSGYGSEAGGEGDACCYANGPWVYGDLAKQGYVCYGPKNTCHTDTGSNKSCHTNTETLTAGKTDYTPPSSSGGTSSGSCHRIAISGSLADFIKP